MPSFRPSAPGVVAPDRLLTASETAQRLGVSPRTLYRWSATWDIDRIGPKPSRLGTALRWRESRVNAYIAAL
ncbi:helix-turn-helix transcriptional regulator [Streptomyces hydrogenans]|uniref:helix-turn-helix transcriptional regulator n=1 Tax=Streptomyces hydrogenans TaxID=1873719 RepID=UPI003813BCFD